MQKQENNPLNLFNTLNETLQRYLLTSLPVSHRYPKLRQAFKQQLAQEQLVKGPYVEALPDFEKGCPLSDLLAMNGGFLHDALSNLEVNILERPLHKHQQQALTAACRDGESLLVATGTGSGKTETFLYPIAHQLLSDPHPDAVGVRCLLVYPMNALANDQLYYRIAPLFGRYLAEDGITFGRFTSQTPKDRRDEEASKLHGNSKLMAAMGDKIPKHWLLTREEMLDKPPKILVTNYAMLEHLLLLPRNAPLFAQNCLQTIVLDEIHTYTGAQATEVAFLLRKLKNRLGLDKSLQVFGTSASFPSGKDKEKEKENDTQILKFASDLFGEKVHRVVRGKREVHQALTGEIDQPFRLSIKTWMLLSEGLKAYSSEEQFNHYLWQEMLEAQDLQNKLPPLDSNLDFPLALQQVFARNHEIRLAAQLLDTQGVQPFASVAKKVFVDHAEMKTADLTTALSGVIHIGMLARQNDNSFPLLPGRYHLAANSIEGICVRLDVAGEGWQDFKLLRHYQTDEAIYYPLLTCRKCGQPYIEAFEHHGALYNRRPLAASSQSRRVFWLGTPPDVHTQDEGDEDEETQENKYEKYSVNPNTGKLEADGITLYRIKTAEDKEEKRTYVRQCPTCGGTPGNIDAEIVTRFHPGNEALASVVTQKVLEALPPNPEQYEPMPFAGRSLLTFSDNRQNAAFFAPYFERTGGDVALRTAIYQVLSEADEPMDLKLLGSQIHKAWRKDGQQPVLLGDKSTILSSWEEMQDYLLGYVAAEFCTPSGRRNSLEALGLVNVSYEQKKLRKVKQDVQALLPESQCQQIDALLHLLLENIRREKAIGNLYDLDMRAQLIWGKNYSSHRAFELQKLDDKVSHAWIPKDSKRHNRRTWYLQEQLGWTRDQAMDFLTAVWESLKQHKLLIRVKPGFGLEGIALRFTHAKQQTLYRCQACGLLQTHVVDERCSAFKCTGQALALTPDERKAFMQDNHYVHTYQHSQATTVRAREHTASLGVDLREQIEQEFADNKINLLSCTTTMEMGVDLGDLEAVVNLNVPPGVANYQQRTGRAGRRAQAAPFCVTVARNGQYDQAMFTDFQGYLRKEVSIPFLNLDNPSLFQRHQLSVLLSGFLRYSIHDLDKNAPALKDLFGENFNQQAHQDFLEKLYAWLENESGKTALQEAEQLTDKLAKHASIGLRGNALQSFFKEQLERLAQEVLERCQQYQDKKQQALAEGTDNKALGKAQYWGKLQEQYLNQYLVNQLSTRSLIPTYSFPTHALSLEVIREHGRQAQFAGSGDIALTRNASLGISEYAPGAEVIANGRIWQSAGLAHYPRMFMPTEYYAACPECQHVDIGSERSDVPNECSQCGASGAKRPIHAFVEPRGFVTAYADRNGKDPGTNRRRERPADEARLIKLPREDQFEQRDHPLVQTALLRAQPNTPGLPSGRLFIVNKGTFGQGYHYCSLCNHAEAAKKPTQIQKKHKQPLSGDDCKNNILYPQDFAHIFDTDVLLLNFSHPLPPIPEHLAEEEANSWRDRLARTLAEALRFAAAELLHIPATELRATFRFNAGYVQAVLYDDIAGGAGYCIRLQETISILELLNAMLNALQCPKDCATACSACLCDYSNQRAWDLFDRKLVLEWLQGFVAQAGRDPWVEQGAVRWEHPSLMALHERLKSADTLHLIADKLWSSDTEIVEEADKQAEMVTFWLLDWLRSGKKLHIHVQQTPEIEHSKMRHEQRRLWRHLEPWLQEGRASIDVLKYCNNEDLLRLPRIFSSSQTGTTVWFSARPAVAVLDALLPKPIYQHTLDAKLSKELEQLLRHATSLDFSPALPMQRFEFKANEARDLKTCFVPLMKAYIECLEIRDPYCGTSNGREPLKEFVTFVYENASELNKLHVHCLEQNYSDAYYQSASLVKQELEQLLNFSGVEVIVKVHPRRDKARFHDRSLKVDVMDENAATTTLNYDLTAGLDYLLNVQCATKVFSY